MTDTGTPEPRGAILQRDKQTYAIVPRTPCGMLSPDILDAISRVARKYAIDGGTGGAHLGRTEHGRGARRGTVRALRAGLPRHGGL